MRNKHFHALDSWRGVCALVVAIYHFTALSHLFYNPFVRHSWLFVDFFFVLSGFVISHAYQDRLRDRHELLSFAIRRFGRIWPLHIFMLLLFIGFEAVKLYLLRHGMTAERQPFTDNTSVPAIFANLLLVQSLPIMSISTWNIPSWSISVEFWTYIVFAAVVAACSSRAGIERRRSAIMFALLFLVCMAILIGFCTTLDVRTDYGIFRCVAGFLAGHCAYRLWQASGDGHGGTAIECGAVILVALFVTLAVGTRFVFLAPVVFAIAVWVFAQEGGALSALMLWRPFRRLGELSFSIYMVHWFIREVIGRAIAFIEKKTHHSFTVPIDVSMSTVLGSTKMISWHGKSGGDLILLGFLCMVVATSVITHALIEKPGQRFFGRYAKAVLTRAERLRAQASPPDPVPL